MEARGQLFRTDMDDAACAANAAKIGPDADGQPGGCDNIHLLLAVRRLCESRYSKALIYPKMPALAGPTELIVPEDNRPEAVPVNIVDTGSAFDTADRPQPGIALCLSGGGYRAMLFHLGALWRLNEWGYLPQLARISSVSGGSITAGVLGLKWASLGLDAEGVGQKFEAEVVQPIGWPARPSTRAPS